MQYTRIGGDSNGAAHASNGRRGDDDQSLSINRDTDVHVTVTHSSTADDDEGDDPGPEEKSSQLDDAKESLMADYRSDEEKHREATKATVKSLSMRRLLKQAAPEKCLLINATIMLFLSAVLNLAIPAFVGAIIDILASSAPGSPPNSNRSAIDQWIVSWGFGDSPSAVLNVAIVVLGLLVLFGAIFSGLRGYMYNLAGERVVQRLRNKLFAQIMMNEVSFFDTTRTGELVNRLSADTAILKDAVTSNVSMGLRWGSTVIGGIVYLFIISWRLTLVMLTVVPIVAISARLYGQRVKSLSKQTQDALARATEVAEESIMNVRTVRSFYREPLQTQLYAERVKDTYVLGARIAMLYGVFIGMITLVGTGSLILVLWYGAKLVLDGDMTAGVLTSFILYTLTVGMSLAGLSGLFASLMSAVGANDRVFELIDRVSHIPLTGGKTIATGQLKGHVQFDNVCFAYPSRKNIEVLQGVTLDFQPGTVTALVGPSGGGKSTIVSLIERFYDVASGQIRIDGHDIRDLDPSWLHRSIALVSQEPVLFATTIKQNISYGVEQASDEDIIKSAQMANAHEFIREMKPLTYENTVGERGVRLSGGQKQRVAIARAMLMNPCILIADEATSSLDAESEYKVQEALDTLMRGRTVIVVAHRLSTVRKADNIVVIDHGKVVEQGRHEELDAKGGLYHKLVARQLIQDTTHPKITSPT